MVDLPSGSLWDFSWALYQKGVSRCACLSLQNRHGLDVNVILFCCWCAFRKELIGKSEMENVLRETDEWQRTVVAPLREIRQNLKHFSQSDKHQNLLRDRVKLLELEAERVEQRKLEELATQMMFDTSQHKTRVAMAVANLDQYFLVLEIKQREEDIIDLRALTGEME